ncbi:MAG: class I SAM-dependent methyltransferase [Propionibacteriaceae bacterium]|nr:class I SAM-dependent methyltransferase [Propionibacteriaceae bacterium]
MTTTITRTDEADQQLKLRHRKLWASGDYGAVAREVIPGLGRLLVEASRIGPGTLVLDVAAGTGNAAIPAARAGARVVASDLTPELLAEGRRDVEAEGLRLEWEPGDAEALPYPDASFDAVMSCVGVMFAPHHQLTADELVRVTRPGGTIGLLNWTPDGFIGRMFAAMRPFMPAPPPGAQPPPLWGDPAHLQELFGDRVDTPVYRVGSLPVTRFATAGEFRDFFRDKYGPTIAAYRNVADAPGRLAALDETLLGLAAAALRGGEMRWEFLLFTATRAADASSHR